jgi:hypothetical protein
MSGSELALDTVVMRNPDVPFSRADDSVIAIDIPAGYCYALNGTGARVWELISAATPISELQSRLCHEFDVDAPTCLRDLLEILARLQDAGLVTCDPN